jgi:hypothetical protein
MMRGASWAAIALAVLGASPASSGVPDPERSGFAVTGQGSDCHFRFRADGGLDRMLVSITVRDAFDTPIANCSLTVALLENEGTLAFCACCPNPVGGFTSMAGVFEAELARIGGRGSLDVAAVTHCVGTIEIARTAIEFTSPDMTGTPEPPGIVALGVWAGCLPPAPYCVWSDFDCSSSVGVTDLGIWAGGLGIGCGSAECP